MGDWTYGELAKAAKENQHFGWVSSPGTEGAFLAVADGFALAKGATQASKEGPLLGLRAVKLDLALAEIGFDAVELAQKIVPEYAAELAVSDGLEAERLLLRDGVLL